MIGLSVPAVGAEDDGAINFSFDQVTIRSFVKLVGDLTGNRFVVADDVEAKVTVVAPRIKRTDVFPLFVSVLESAGCSVVEDGGLYRVIKLLPRKSHIARVVGAGDEVPETAGLITKVFHLQHVRASDVSRAIEPRVSGGGQGSVAAIDETNHLIVTDTASSIRRIEEMIEEVDRAGLARVTEVITLKHIGAEDLAAQLSGAMSDGETRGSQLKKRLPTTAGVAAGSRVASVIASTHANQLILTGSPPQLVEMKRLVSLMDIESPPGRGRLNAIFLKYISAEEAAKNLMSLLNGGGPDKVDGSAAKRGDVSIQASPANNALLVDSSAADFEVVERLIEQLDRMPEQVHISVLIAEQSATDRLDLSVEMAGIDQPSDVDDYVVQGGSLFSEGTESLMNVVQSGIFPDGITFGIGRGSYYDDDGNLVVGYPGIINIEAIKQNRNVRIQSETALEAQNNREASVRIVDEIPVLKSTIEGGSGTSRDVIQNIDRMEVGIKLKLTPHIIPDGLVQMDLNPSIEAVIETGSSAEYTPTIARREVSTTVTVPDGRTIVIAGLTREDTQKVVKRVPLLGSIPLLGFLFRDKSDSVEKTNMLIFVTPRIVSNVAMAESVKREWSDKTGLHIDDSE